MEWRANGKSNRKARPVSERAVISVLGPCICMDNTQHNDQRAHEQSSTSLASHRKHKTNKPQHLCENDTYLRTGNLEP